VSTVIGLSGSLRAGSSNAGLLRAAARLRPEWSFRFYDQELGQLPCFSPELDGEGAIPAPAVATFRALLAGADGVIISCPEYAHGVPGAFKNALDWLVSSGELSGKPTVVFMASPSGAEFARAALIPTLEVIETKLVFVESLRFARSHLDADGRLNNAAIESTVAAGLEALGVAMKSVS